MASDGKRLQAWRESLPGEVSRRAMCVSLDWEESRWWQLERKERWNARQREELRAGLAAILERADANAEVRGAWLSYVLGEGKRPAHAFQWLPGQCPAQPIGRPAGKRYKATARTSASVSHDGERPVLPAEVRREQTALILRSLQGGKLDLATAERAIFDIFAPLDAYYNKQDSFDHDAA